MIVTDDLMRIALWASALFNTGGALAFAFPETLGPLAGVPLGTPAVQNTLLILFILLFAGAYSWLACQPRIDRPLVGLAAIGKAGAFVAVLVLWLLGDAPGLSVAAFAGDLLLALVFAAWLRGAPRPTVDRSIRGVTVWR